LGLWRWSQRELSPPGKAGSSLCRRSHRELSLPGKTEKKKKKKKEKKTPRMKRE